MSSFWKKSEAEAGSNGRLDSLGSLGSLDRRDVRLKAFLEGLYFIYNRRELVNPDPLVFLYAYDDPLDREVAGLVASCLAYGRVAQIMKNVEKILSAMGRHPHRLLLRDKSGLQVLLKNFKAMNFKHRFTTGEHMAGLLTRTSEALREYGSLEELLRDCLRKGGTLLEALNFFSRTLSPMEKGFSLLAAPEGGSACKRLLLYLKWMTRRDDVDPGGWTAIGPKVLLLL
ncbi:MAG: DUF2400 domain-containing protein [Synergistaceae bacterium]|nr:DUF2400 domain-containing protein [Synergistaceae bacterium]